MVPKDLTVIPPQFSSANDIFHRTIKKISQFIWKHKRAQIAKTVLRKMELEESTFLTSDYTTKLWSSRQYGTGTETEM